MTDQDEQRDKLFFEVIFDMTMAYLDVLKELDNDPHLFASLAGMESALGTAMPYIKKQLVAEMEAEGYKSESHCGLCPFAGCGPCENSEREIIAKLDKGACGKRGTKQKKEREQ